MQTTFYFYKSYVIIQTIVRIVALGPLLLIGVAAWQLFVSSDPLGFRIILFSVMTVIMSVFCVVLRKVSQAYGPEHTFYDITITTDSLVCKNKQNSIVVSIKDIKNIKIGGSVIFIYSGNDVVRIPSITSAQKRSFFDLIRRLRPDLDISHYFPFSYIQP